MITIRKVAEACNVSVASVSKALNHAPDIGEETARRIRETAAALGYRPNATARALKTNRSHNVGVLFVDETHCGLTHEYFGMVLNSLKNQAEELGYDITFISQNLGGSKMSFLEHCRYRNCDGVVIASIDFQNPMVTELVSSDVPVVTIDEIFEQCSSVVTDNRQCVRALVEYVYGMGHRRIAFIHGEDTAVTRSRLEGFCEACDRLGIETPEAYRQCAVYHDPRSSGLATRALLELPEPPTCILFPDDFSFIGGMNEIERHGLRIPDDVSVAGFDGILLSQVLRPKLTTLRQDAEHLGAEAVKLLIEAIEHPKSFRPKHLVLPGEVLEGGTVKRLIP